MLLAFICQRSFLFLLACKSLSAKSQRLQCCSSKENVYPLISSFFHGQRCGIRIVGYPDTWISRHFWLANCIQILKLLKHPIIQLSNYSKELRYPSIRILDNLRYPTIHVSMDTWIHRYIQLSNYPWIPGFQILLDTCNINKIYQNLATFFVITQKNDSLSISIQVSRTIHYSSIHDI